MESKDFLGGSIASENWKKGRHIHFADDETEELLTPYEQTSIPYEVNSDKRKKKGKKQRANHNSENPSSKIGKEDSSAIEGLSGGDDDTNFMASTSNNVAPLYKSHASDKRKQKLRRDILVEEIEALDASDERSQHFQIENGYDRDNQKLPSLAEYLKTSLEEGEPFIPMLTGDPLCPYCRKLFSKSSHRNHHVRAVHLKIKPYKCSYCDKSFSEKQTLKVHEYLHTGEMRYECSVCQRTFRNVSNMYQHQKRHVLNTTIISRASYKRVRSSDSDSENSVKRRKKNPVEEVIKKRERTKTTGKVKQEVVEDLEDDFEQEQIVHLILQNQRERMEKQNWEDSCK